MCNEDLAPRRAASVLSSCMLQSAICFPVNKFYGSPGGTDVIQTESPENFVVIFEILPTDKELKSNELRIADLGRVVALTGKLLFKVTFFPHRLHSNSNSSTLFCFTEQNSNSASFHSHSVLDYFYLLLTRFSSEVDFVKRSCPSQVSSSPLLARFSIEWLPFLM